MLFYSSLIEADVVLDYAAALQGSALMSADTRAGVYCKSLAEYPLSRGCDAIVSR